METLDAFKLQQAKTVGLLEKLLDFLHEGQQFGVEIDPKFIAKLQTGINETAAEKLKVALIGGFSEGKTSIAAAWAEKYDKASMKISEQESSNEVSIYHLEDFDLIDTPGLFGYKETADKERYKDITKKYVSEAHLVLYVMNSTNPIKDSHKEELTWLFKELNLLPRTVFVLSRFDEVTDIEDDDDYSKSLTIKQQNIVGRLKDFGLIENGDSVSIVAVAANPFDRGTDYWLSNLGEFKKLSRIDLLQKATQGKISENGNATALVVATKKSIISDILRRELPVAVERDVNITRECERFAQMCAEIKNELVSTKEQVSSTRIRLREFVSDFFTVLIMQAKGLSMETHSDFVERNIGNEGIVLETHLQNKFEQELGTSRLKIGKMETTLNAEVNQYNSVIGSFAKQGLKQGVGMLKNFKVGADGVKAARNFIRPSLKFKPWGAVKLASKLSKSIPIIGEAASIAIDVWDSWQQREKEKKFREGIDEMVSNFEQQRKGYLEHINDDATFIQFYFPEYIELQDRIKKLDAEMYQKRLQHDQFQQWREHGEVIEAEFEDIS
jgi:GTPase SAR1 family protein